MKKPSENKKPIAYYKVMVKNSRIDEFRKNAWEREHSFPMGKDVENYTSTRIQIYVCKNVEDWLNHIEDSVLEKELRALSAENLQILYDSFVMGFTHKEIAQTRGLSRSAVGKRITRIVNYLRTKCKLI